MKERTRRPYVLPPGFHLGRGPCTVCGKPYERVEDIEGLPVYACPDGCEDEAEPGRKRANP